MRKIILLIAAAAFSTTMANAQNARQSIVKINGGMEKKEGSSVLNMNSTGKSTVQLSATRPTNNFNSMARTTAAGGERWYNYVDYLVDAGTLPSPVPSYFPYTWFRDNALAVYDNGSGGTTYDSIGFTSFGFVLDPMIDDFNDPAVYSGAMAITPINAYQLDTVVVFGVYERPRTETDTMRFSFFFGDGSDNSTIDNNFFTGMSSRYGSDTVKTLTIHHDSLSNLPIQGSSGSSILTIDVPMTAATAIDTTASGLAEVVCPIPSGLSIPAGKFVGATYAFKTGANFPNLDTVILDNGGTTVRYKYNEWRPFVAHMSGTPISFPTYHDWAVDGNTGMSKYVPNPGWFGFFVPMWAWYTQPPVGGASPNQYPYVSFKLSCATCHPVSVPVTKNVISAVRAYPVPAVSEVYIPFTLSQNADVKISLVNTLGQVVKMQSLSNVSQGKVTFNVSDLAAGVYLYNVEANNQRSTGRVVVAH